MRIKESTGDRIFGAVVNTILALCVLACAYPLYLVLINSFSDPDLVSQGKVWWRPIGFTLDAYMEVFKNKDILQGYGNALYYTVLGTALNMVLTIPAAYALAKPQLYGRNAIMKLLVFTMYFSGGLVPHYILMQGLGLLNTRMGVLVVGAVATTNLIIARTFFASSIPRELEEAAEIDGCSELQTFWKIVLPLSKAIMAVITLYYMVGHWNSYFTEMMYLRDREKYPIQLILRSILSMSRVDPKDMQGVDGEQLSQMIGAADVLKYGLIVISTVPILCVYPFIQKYFEKGVMVGSVKG